MHAMCVCVFVSVFVFVLYVDALQAVPMIRTLLSEHQLQLDAAVSNNKLINNMKLYTHAMLYALLEIM
jgi:hypothetical protein